MVYTNSYKNKYNLKRQNVLFVGIIFLIFGTGLFGQHQDLKEKPKIWQSEEKSVTDSMTLLSAFKKGKVNGHFRYFFSATDNKGDLSDYYASAVGGGLRFETATYKGFSSGISGFYLFNAGSGDLLKKDSLTGQPNRYEISLFDLTNTESLEEINRVEEFFIKYQKNDFKVTFGRQLLNTPFINLQDGRMRPTAAEGFWVEAPVSKMHGFQLGWVYGMAPRSTSKWYDIGESVGLYTTGIDTSGERSKYSKNVNTKGAFLFNYHLKPISGLEINLWNLYFDNVFNITLLQAEMERSLGNGTGYLGSQNAMQVKVGQGGNVDSEKAYYQNKNNVFILGGRLGWKNKKWDHSLNVNRISDGGKFLMPREWGRDYFYTFMPRERNEGQGDVTAIVVKSVYKMNKDLSVIAMLGKVHLSDVENFYLNKYGLPSYLQLNMDIRYRFSGWLQGLEAQFLFVNKWKQGENYDNLRYVIHKVDMQLYNVILNFRF
ncbi:MAG: hypothetical protein IPF52_14875 [Saprospiraceae bacterium]|nr:hypothetical protein [Saprospiraceae bacterium]